jgi:hypothetical protein
MGLGAGNSTTTSGFGSTNLFGAQRPATPGLGLGTGTVSTTTQQPASNTLGWGASTTCVASFSISFLRNIVPR